MSDQTKADLIVSAVKNHPRGAWIVVLGTLLLITAQVIGALDAIGKFLFPPKPPVEWSVVFSLPWELQVMEEYRTPGPGRRVVILRATVTNRGSHHATILDSGFVLGEGDSQWDPLRSIKPFTEFTIREGEVKSIEISIPFDLDLAPGQSVFPRGKEAYSTPNNGMVPIGLYVLSTDSRGQNYSAFFPVAYGNWEGGRFVRITPLTRGFKGYLELTTVELLTNTVIMPSEVVGRWRMM